jgi:hypothetical protein
LIASQDLSVHFAVQNVELAISPKFLQPGTSVLCEAEAW